MTFCTVKIAVSSFDYKLLLNGTTDIGECNANLENSKVWITWFSIEEKYQKRDTVKFSFEC